MQKVVPAIIPESIASLKDTLTLVQPFSYEVQIDIVDGVFVPFRSWPYGAGDRVEDVLPYAETFSLEFDLMIKNPEAVLPQYVSAGAKSIIIHLESTENLEAVFAHRKANEYRLGLSILNDTPLDLLLDHLHQIDFVQLMGIKEIGSQGQPFDERVLSRIRELKSIAPAILVSIDGSVTTETLPRLKEAGALRFISGSAILKAEEPREAFDALLRLAT